MRRVNWNIITSRKNQLLLIAILGCSISIIGFFLPWRISYWTTSTGIIGSETSGLDWAMGHIGDYEAMRAYLFIFPIAILTSAILHILSQYFPLRSRKSTSFAIVLNLLAMALLFAWFGTDGHDMVKIGWYVSSTGAIIALIPSILILRGV